MKLIIASNNAHKMREIFEILGAEFPDMVTLKQAGLSIDVVEDGDTFAANAIKKAEEVRRISGFPAALADDSGLMVDALDGAPGVHSARFAGVHGDDAANNALLMEKLQDVPAPRTAQFVSAIALASPFLPSRLFEGVCPGVVTFEPRGQQGFGYDPYFEYENGKTFAEMTDEEKGQVSHRARAMQKLLEALG